MSPTFIFDGDCAFCTTCANFVNRWIPTGAKVSAWQRADLAALGLTRAQCLEAVQWVEEGRPTLAGPEAIGALLRSSNAAWKPVGYALKPRAVTAALWPLYRWVARHRHQMPGGTAACAIPLPSAPSKA
ncbi:DCC1-like thiol-disulfide oxidoreductase family protein [Catellatospora sp. KI3]|uniref:thiol-disulfide oxidoreductase DCC family protein n=1 Tax=Catellatospora sp. KI3 TaxID=3041620 RepID=UPI0024825031|nr:DCC1-like thiol-disulfide oxidoreductase family protein [Catellatospora sp. KI3]MDI1460041.1 DCC1-like thiol-disulfide oxidoreductase family protein [Catellatospora sp. KI3]